MNIKNLKINFLFILVFFFLLNCTNKNESLKKTDNKEKITVAVEEHKIDCFDFDKIKPTKQLHTGGCAGFFVYSKISEKDFLIIKGFEGLDDKFKIGYCYAFDLKYSNDWLKIHIDQREDEAASYNGYCNDMIMLNASKPRQFLPIKGKIIVKITQPGSIQLFNGYIENVIFVSRTDTIKLDKILLKDVNINFRPG